MTNSVSTIRPGDEAVDSARVGGVRAQVAALPIRRGADGPEVLLVTSRDTHRWIIPKGWPMKGRRDHEAAAQEALEEAGVSGRIRKRPLGGYSYGKRVASGVERCRVMVYRLDVEQEHESWRERDQRTREWVPVREAASRVLEPALANMILLFDRADEPKGRRPRGAISSRAVPHPT